MKICFILFKKLEKIIEPWLRWLLCAFIVIAYFLSRKFDDTPE